LSRSLLLTFLALGLLATGPGGVVEGVHQPTRRTPRKQLHHRFLAKREEELSGAKNARLLQAAVQPARQDSTKKSEELLKKAFITDTLIAGDEDEDPVMFFQLSQKAEEKRQTSDSTNSTDHHLVTPQFQAVLHRQQQMQNQKQEPQHHQHQQQMQKMRTAAEESQKQKEHQQHQAWQQVNTEQLHDGQHKQEQGVGDSAHLEGKKKKVNSTDASSSSSSSSGSRSSVSKKQQQALGQPQPQERKDFSDEKQKDKTKNNDGTVNNTLFMARQLFSVDTGAEEETNLGQKMEETGSLPDENELIPLADPQIFSSALELPANSVLRPLGMAFFLALLVLLGVVRMVQYSERPVTNPVRRYVERMPVLKAEQLLRLTSASSASSRIGPELYNPNMGEEEQDGEVDTKAALMMTRAQHKQLQLPHGPGPALSAWWQGTVIRVEGRVEKGAGGFDALVSPLGRQLCVHFSTSVAAPRTDGIHPPPVAFHSLSLDFKIALLPKNKGGTQSPPSLTVRGPDLSLFDMRAGRLQTTNCTFNEAEEHWQSFVMAQRCSGVDLLLEIDHQARDSVRLEFQEARLDLDALVTCVGELCVTEDGEVGLAPLPRRERALAKEEEMRRSDGKKRSSRAALRRAWWLPWRLCVGKEVPAPDEEGPMIGDGGTNEEGISSSLPLLPQKVMISDDPKLLKKGGARHQIQKKGSEVFSALFGPPPEEEEEEVARPSTATAATRSV